MDQEFTIQTKNSESCRRVEVCTLEYDWDVVKRYVDVVCNLVLSTVSQWNNYDENTSCYMEHILRFRLCVALQTDWGFSLLFPQF